MERATESSQHQNLREGLTVVGADGGKIGQVVGVQAAFFVVEKGFFFPTDYYVPVDAIDHVTGEQVHLKLPKEEALHQGWDVLPVEEAEALHKDAATAGTTLGGYTTEMGQMDAEVDVSAAEISAALDPATSGHLATSSDETEVDESAKAAETEPAQAVSTAPQAATVIVPKEPAPATETTAEPAPVDPAEPEPAAAPAPDRDEET